MVEMLLRERQTSVAQWELTMVAIALFLGTPGESAAQATSFLRKELEDRVFQRAYDAPNLLGKLQARLDHARKDLDLLKKVDALSQGDEGTEEQR
jgi:hypothetical protein